MKPVVLRLAKLFPTTSIAVESACKADRAVENEVNIYGFDQEFVYLAVPGGVPIVAACWLTGGAGVGVCEFAEPAGARA